MSTFAIVLLVVLCICNLALIATIRSQRSTIVMLQNSLSANMTALNQLKRILKERKDD